MIGRKYKVSFAKLAGTCKAATTPESFFCSELVAHAYQRAGLLPAESPPSGYWPVTFGEANGLLLEGGAFLEEEVRIDFHTPGVASARPCFSSPQQRSSSDNSVCSDSDSDSAARNDGSSGTGVQ